jgi:hypothetical protein
MMYSNNMQIKPYAKNAKKHPQKQIDQLAAIVREVGWRQPILVNQEGVIVAGHGRWETYQQNQDLAEPWVIDDAGKTIMGEPASIPLSKEQEIAYRLADNKLAETDVDMGLVIEELKELEALGELAPLTGYGDDFNPEVSDEFSLPEGDKPNYKQITFTLHNEQADLIDECLSLVKQLGVEPDTDNENSNGNAIYTIVKQWHQQKTS